MRVSRLVLRDFRGYTAEEVWLGSELTVITGPNGAGKTNLLEGLYFGCTGRSCRTANERECVRWGEKLCRVELHAEDADGAHVVGVGFEPGQPKRLSADGAPVERLLGVAVRPLVSVFLPDRLELVKGTPAGRRAHLDQVVGALWPARAATRRGYVAALAQRNALLGRVRAGLASRSSLPAWDAELVRHGLALMADRARAAGELADRFAALAAELGVEGEAALVYRPRSRAGDAEGLTAELGARLEGDLERGFTAHGPHRDELALLRDGRELRAYGSQGEQRLALLALLLAERDAIAGVRGTPPLLLLDDVMSELDGERRRRLVERVGAGGQTVITTTDGARVPGAGQAGVARLAVASGRVSHEVGGLPRGRAAA